MFKYYLYNADYIVGLCYKPASSTPGTEHGASAVGKHIKKVHGVTTPEPTKIGSKEMPWKTGLLIVHEMLLIKTRSQIQYVRKYLFNHILFITH